MIKEKTANYCVIRLPHYGGSFEIISELVSEAKNDFITLKNKDINVVKYGGRYYRGTYGIEFKIPKMKIDNLYKYDCVSQLEYVA